MQKELTKAKKGGDFEKADELKRTLKRMKDQVCFYDVFFLHVEEMGMFIPR